MPETTSVKTKKEYTGWAIIDGKLEFFHREVPDTSNAWLGWRGHCVEGINLPEFMNPEYVKIERRLKNDKEAPDASA